MSRDPKQMWESRYSSDDAFLYGREPNDFLAASVGDVTPGDALCLADGEGRNGVHLAALGHTVTSVDLAEAGMAKAAQLAAEHNVDLTTVVADLGDFDLGENRWDMIVSIYAHTPAPVRIKVHENISKALRPNGLFILEAYTPDQVGRGTGGPRTAEFAMTLEGLRQELAGMAIIEGRELVRPVLEGQLHTGDGAVVQVIASPEG